MAPKKLVAVDDRLTAVQAMRYAAQGTAMLWLGDFYNAKQILSALDRRLAKGRGRAAGQPAMTGAEEFYRIRQARAQRSRMMSLVLVPLTFDTQSGSAIVPLPRAPQVGPAVEFGYGQHHSSSEEGAVVSLQELIGVQSAYQWFLNGVDVPALNAKIHPHYGTFLPTRHEYVDLVAQAPLNSRNLAFDVGTGTGVLAAVLVNRGVKKVLGTDLNQRAVDCANDNFARLGMQGAAEAQLTSMFPAGRAPLIVCNPPWLPGSAATTLDAAVYDPGSKMLLQFLTGLPHHLTDDGEGWLILSDLAELLGLRSRQMLLDAIDEAGLHVIDRLDTAPTHRRAKDSSDLLHAARSREVTSLWRLQTKGSVPRR
ncbi:methyltransferase [Corynebacterium hylobatis]|uniref:methyltransferase n=1 Tax=Corynebacterium hylobatis TaxID=1859290 RepID=UPI001F496FC3|nr:class I SAM-dependent methyltransferase [Corynebacterium hylobatis]